MSKELLNTTTYDYENSLCGKRFYLVYFVSPKRLRDKRGDNTTGLPKTHINIDIKLPTIPTAPKDIVVFSDILPTIMVSVIDKIGSAIPEISAGIANF